ncbi:MAG: PfkB family carbohydrate kinase, partial [Saprospiraceae bacterium]|nr:PfkB family carbohydrate kinase [Saprospiraceae bacterium]
MDTFDIICAGELLIDLISEEFKDSLDEAELFRRLPGGSPANLCMNMSRLGNRALLVSTVGNDEMGHFLIEYVCSLGVDCRHIRRA